MKWCFIMLLQGFLDKNLGEFDINNLEVALLSDNAMTRLCKKHDILFKAEEGISVYKKITRYFLINQWKQDSATG